MSRPDWMRPFARSIFAKVEGLKSLPDLSPSQRSRLRESISDDIKKASNFHAHDVSEEAHRVAQELGVDLSVMTWHEQPSFDAGRETFLVEHLEPVSALRARCLCANSEEDVLRILTEELRVVWITREEDDTLTEKGFRTKRPDGGAAAYAAVGIKLRTRGRR